MNKVTNYSNEEIIKVLEDAKSFSDVVRYFGYKSVNTGSYSTVKNELMRRKIEIPKYNYYGDGNKYNRKTDNEVFAENSSYSRTHLKQRIIKNNLIPYICDNCNNKGEWMDNKLVLQLEHKNGVHNDNRIGNICFLCPNCHSQSDTFSGRNSKREKKRNFCECGKEIHVTSKRCPKCYAKTNRKVDRPPYEKILQEIKYTSHNDVARKYGVSWRTIKKWIIDYEKEACVGIEPTTEDFRDPLLNR